MCARIVKIHTIRIRALESVENSLFIWFRKNDFYFASIKFISNLYLRWKFWLWARKINFIFTFCCARIEEERKKIDSEFWPYISGTLYSLELLCQNLYRAQIYDHLEQIQTIQITHFAAFCACLHKTNCMSLVQLENVSQLDKCVDYSSEYAPLKCALPLPFVLIPFNAVKLCMSKMSKTLESCKARLRFEL